MSGKEDFISNGKNEESLSFGSPLMPLITGMGCSLTSIIGAFRSIISDPFEAAEIAVTYFCLCGNLAHSKTAKPGIFRQIFIDELYEANFIEMRRFFNESV